jgi:hypothetical protein
VLCDNASQFKAVASIVEKHSGRVNKEKFAEYLVNHGVKFSYISAFSPWKGGVYERMVQTVKRAFRKAVGRRVLNSVQLATVLAEVQYIVNTRPLVYIGSEFDQREALSPASFLNMNLRTIFPDPTADIDDVTDPDYNPKPESTRNKLKHMFKCDQALLNELWDAFKGEYLLGLRQQHQSKHKKSPGEVCAPPKEGQVVIVAETLQPRSSWKLARIEKLKVSEDGQIRSAKVRVIKGKLSGSPILRKVKTTLIERPINKLYPLEVEDESDVKPDD